MMSARARLALVLLALLAVAGLLVQNGSVPHRHDDHEAGLYNQEHDLALLASLAAQATPVDATPALAVDGVSAPVAPFVPARPPLRHARGGSARAPPSA